MRAQPCHVIESAMIKTQHVIACRNNDDPGLFDAHGGNRHLGLIQSCSHYFDRSAAGASSTRAAAAMRYSQQKGAAHSTPAATTAGKTARGEGMNPNTVLFGPGLLRNTAANWLSRLDAPSKMRFASKAVGAMAMATRMANAMRRRVSLSARGFSAARRATADRLKKMMAGRKW